jgi:nitrous oxidase accessory protein
VRSWRVIFGIIAFALLGIRVSGEGVTLTVCPSCELSTLHAAIATANVGDHIVVQAGHYAEGEIIIDKPLTLEGEDFPILDGEHKTQIITITADDVTVRGFVLQNAGYSDLEELAAIRVEQKSNCLIENNKLYNDYFGIYLAKAQHCQIINNEVISKHEDSSDSSGETLGQDLMGESESFSGNALHLWNASHITAKNNRFEGHRDGIYLEFVKDALIANNVSINNLRYGLHFMFSEDIDFERNNFHHNGAGVAVMFSKHITMHENEFSENQGSSAYGLLLKEVSDSSIDANIFAENTIALYADGGNRLEVTNNTFTRNGYALRIYSSSMAMMVTRNDFFANTFDASTNSTRSFNAFPENYWADYQSYDLDHDGIGDVPFRPVRLSSMTIESYPQAVILLRSPLMQFMDYAERLLPTFTPKAIEDDRPLIRKSEFYTPTINNESAKN